MIPSIVLSQGGVEVGGIYVKGVLSGGAADLDRRIRKGKALSYA